MSLYRLTSEALDGACDGDHALELGTPFWASRGICARNGWTVRSPRNRRCHGCGITLNPRKRTGAYDRWED